jgi:hypothetical protein
VKEDFDIVVRGPGILPRWCRFLTLASMELFGRGVT